MGDDIKLENKPSAVCINCDHHDNLGFGVKGIHKCLDSHIEQDPINGVITYKLCKDVNKGHCRKFTTKKKRSWFSRLLNGPYSVP